MTQMTPLPRGVQRLVDEALELRASSQALTEVANSATAIAAQQLVHVAGLTLADAADLLGLSPQRVHQLVGPANRPRCGAMRPYPDEPYRGQSCIRRAGHPGGHRYRDDSLMTPEVLD
jgi:hypothetical protein